VTPPKIVVHTDVFLGHLTGDRHPSVLRRAMGMFFCYTTVFQAIEVFALAESEQEYSAMEDSMSAMKIMGLNPKQARAYGVLLNAARKLDTLNVLVAGLCRESRLPILTDRKQDFHGLKDLLVVPTRLLFRYGSAQEVLNAARQ
jgi:predicted nucleic acid-binding protein